MADASFVSFTSMVERIKEKSDVAQTYVYNFMAGGKPKIPLSASKENNVLFLMTFRGSPALLL